MCCHISSYKLVVTIEDIFGVLVGNDNYFTYRDDKYYYFKIHYLKILLFIITSLHILYPIIVGHTLVALARFYPQLTLRTRGSAVTGLSIFG